MRRLQFRNDVDGIVRVLSSRADELDVVIAKVSASGSYSIRDKQIMLRVLEKRSEVGARVLLRSCHALNNEPPPPPPEKRRSGEKKRVFFSVGRL